MAQQAVHTAAKQELSKQLVKVLDVGEKLATFLCVGVRQHYGRTRGEAGRVRPAALPRPQAGRARRAAGVTPRSYPTQDPRARSPVWKTGPRVPKKKRRPGKSGTRVGKTEDRVRKAPGRVPKAKSRVGEAMDRDSKALEAVGIVQRRDGDAKTRVFVFKSRDLRLRERTRDDGESGPGLNVPGHRLDDSSLDLRDSNRSGDVPRRCLRDSTPDLADSATRPSGLDAGPSGLDPARRCNETEL